MDQRLSGPAIATLNGIQFWVLVAERRVECRLKPEAMLYLRDQVLGSAPHSPLRLFRRMFEEVMSVAMWKHAKGAFEADGSLVLTIEDVAQALNFKRC